MIDDADFLERLSIIAGQTTYREPIGGVGTKVHHIPAAHCLLVTLCGARGKPWTPGPEIAFTLLTGVEAKKDRVIPWLVKELGWHSQRLVKKCDADMPMICEAAYRSATGLPPMNMAGWDDDLLKLVKTGASILEGAMDDTISRAEDNENGGYRYAAQGR